MMNKRVLRQFAVPNGRPNPKNGIFCAEQIEYVVRTAIKNIDHQRTLVLYIYVREDVLTGDHTPRWTMFQQKDGYITLCTDDTGTRWQRSMFVNLGKDHFFRDKSLSIPKPTRCGSRNIAGTKSRKDLTVYGCFSWICWRKSKGRTS